MRRRTRQNHRPSSDFERRPALGRIYIVRRETWRLTDDPQKTPPAIEVLATRRTASEAADLAREAAAVFSRRGFHKPSGAWWASDEGAFHRFRVLRRQAAPGLAIALVSAATGLALLSALRRRRPAPG